MTATDQLAALDAKVDETQVRYSAALDASRNRRDLAVDVTRPLADYFHQIEARLRERDAEELRRLMDDFWERIKSDDLELVVPKPGVMSIADPRVAQEEEDALAARNAATSERDTFKQATRAERDAERKSREADAIKEALDSGDADRIREALNGPQGDGPLTSNDLTSAGRVTRGV
jgi:hypothetical protein